MEVKIPGFKIRPFNIADYLNGWKDLVREFNTRMVWQYRWNFMAKSVEHYSTRCCNDYSSAMGWLWNDTGTRCEMGLGFGMR